MKVQVPVYSVHVPQCYAWAVGRFLPPSGFFWLFLAFSELVGASIASFAIFIHAIAIVYTIDKDDTKIDEK